MCLSIRDLGGVVAVDDDYLVIHLFWCSHVYVDYLDHFIVHLIIERIKQFVILFTYNFLLLLVLLC